MKKIEEKMGQLLQKADIQINGSRPWDMQIYNNNVYSRIFRRGSIGLGESYMDGWWEAEDLDDFFYRIMMADLDQQYNRKAGRFFHNLKALIYNLQKKSRAYQIGKRHYDMGNDLYRVMLDNRMVYTGAYWENAGTLDKAQEQKLDLVCRKIGLLPGQTVLDIGCGWGSFAKYAAEIYGAKVTGITVSQEQVTLGNELCRGLPVTIRLMDYRDMTQRFDHVVSLGMLEHVGYKNYGLFFDVVRRCLSKDGTFLLQTIGSDYPVRSTDPWIEKYIFPNSMLPSISQLADSFEGTLVMEDWQNLSVNYDKTLMAWFRNFNRGWDRLKNRYSERFYRMWKYYLLMSAGAFRARKLQLWQVVFTKSGRPEGFRLNRYRSLESEMEGRADRMSIH